MGTHTTKTVESVFSKKQHFFLPVSFFLIFPIQQNGPYIPFFQQCLLFYTIGFFVCCSTNFLTYYDLFIYIICLIPHNVICIPFAFILISFCCTSEKSHQLDFPIQSHRAISTVINIEPENCLKWS